MLETRDDVRLLFTDVRMPGLCDGMDLARQVHAHWPHILLVITSGHARPAKARPLRNADRGVILTRGQLMGEAFLGGPGWLTLV